ncbi:hypothetical protein TWF569_001473 [Orbilia oligospora]|nr:hypothetical protein TWF569_001473 [Orbilia oligospora]
MSLPSNNKLQRQHSCKEDIDPENVPSRPEHFARISSHRELREPLEGKQLPNVLPHSIEAGDDAYYIGDVYAPSDVTHDWEIDTCEEPPPQQTKSINSSVNILNPSDDRCYLQYIKNISRGWPGLSYLSKWMEVTTSPVKWKHITADNRKIRAERTKVAIIDVLPEGPEVQWFYDIHKLEEFFKNPKNINPDHERLFIVEDISRDVVELLGSHYNVDPFFWRGHISDYLWYNTRDPWVELEELPHIAGERNHFNLPYVHPRYFQNHESYLRATVEAGKMNVLRRLDNDGINVYVLDNDESVVALCRSKASFWMRPEGGKAKEERALGILVVDPSFTEGSPLWGGYRNFDPCPPLHAQEFRVPPQNSLFYNTVHWTMKNLEEQQGNLKHQPKLMAVSILNIIAAEWLTVKQYLITRLTQIEWELQVPDFRGEGVQYGLDRCLSRLHPFRRSLPAYRRWVESTLNGILNDEDLKSLDSANNPLVKARTDFTTILRELDVIEGRVHNMVNTVATILSLEGMKKSTKQNDTMARLTILASIFGPLSFVSSFLSMTPDITELRSTAGYFFILAIPLTLFAISIAQWPSIKTFVIARCPKRRPRGNKHMV